MKLACYNSAFTWFSLTHCRSWKESGAANACQGRHSVRGQVVIASGCGRLADLRGLPGGGGALV